MSRCRSCGAPILWARSWSGRSMPVDAEPCDEGNLVIETESGGARVALVLTGDALAVTRRGPAPLHRSHFATCPNASQHRSRR